MKFPSFLTLAVATVSHFSVAFAAKSFSASNLYYAAGLKADQQTFLLKGLQSAGVKVLRVWLDGTSSLMQS
jgi:mannan endo-1,4-beta-mannosidase